jgi:hypothetical protein
MPATATPSYASPATLDNGNRELPAPSRQTTTASALPLPAMPKSEHRTRIFETYIYDYMVRSGRVNIARAMLETIPTLLVEGGVPRPEARAAAAPSSDDDAEHGGKGTASTLTESLFDAAGARTTSRNGTPSSTPPAPSPSPPAALPDAILPMPYSNLGYLRDFFDAQQDLLEACHQQLLRRRLEMGEHEVRRPLSRLVRILC